MADQSNEVFIFVGEDANISDDVRARLEALAEELGADDVAGFEARAVSVNGVIKTCKLNVSVTVGN